MSTTLRDPVVPGLSDRIRPLCAPDGHPLGWIVVDGRSELRGIFRSDQAHEALMRAHRVDIGESLRHAT